MAGKDHGIGNALYVEGHDLSGETQTWTISGQKKMQNVTNIRQAAFDRLALIPDGSFNYESLFDPAVGHSHAYLSTLPTTDALTLLAHRETIGAPAWNMYCKQIDYNPSRNTDGALLFKVAGQSSKGTFWDVGNMLTNGMRVDVAATNGASFNFGAANAFGLQAYLHVFAFTGTTCTVKLQHSSDNGGTDPFADIAGGAFTAITGGAPYGERLTTARNLAVKQYLRVVTTGTITSVTFAVAAVVNTINVAV